MFRTDFEPVQPKPTEKFFQQHLLQHVSDAVSNVNITLPSVRGLPSSVYSCVLLTFRYPYLSLFFSLREELRSIDEGPVTIEL